MKILPPLPNDEVLDVTKDDINRLLLESYKKCSNSGEEVAVLREMAKINGHYEKQASTQVNILHIEKQVKQLENLSDEELMQLAGDMEQMFQLPEPIDVTPTEIEDASS